MSKEIISETFNEKSVIHAIEMSEILLVDLETNLTCNGRCIYCYNSKKLDIELNFVVPYEKVIGRVNKVIEAGVKTISLIGGGEPTIYKFQQRNMLDIIRYIRKKGIKCQIFTNGLIFGNTKLCENIFSCSPKEVINTLYNLEVTIFLKFHSLSRPTYETLIGVKNSYDYFINGLQLFLGSKYINSRYPQLVLECVMCKLNYNEIQDLWRYTRKRNIIPSFELLRPTKSTIDSGIVLNKKKIKKLFESISEIDCKEFQNKWPPIPPYLGYTCDLNRFMCYIDVKGNIYNCESFAVYIGNIDDDIAVQDLIKSSKMMQKLRNIKTNITGKCKDCIFLRNNTCYGGCRGFSWEINNDSLSSDPICWIMKG
ncbi:MAG: radical SAM protein [Candidatus Omnitrophica bacterium]|nr:radical SAM protein [Candidatus Omnitrophota bacterium]